MIVKEILAGSGCKNPEEKILMLVVKVCIGAAIAASALKVLSIESKNWDNSKPGGWGL